MCILHTRVDPMRVNWSMAVATSIESFEYNTIRQGVPLFNSHPPYALTYLQPPLIYELFPVVPTSINSQSNVYKAIATALMINTESDKFSSVYN